MRTFLKWIVLLVVLGAAGWFAARWALGSSWGRDIAERRLGRVLEMDISVGSVGLEWPLVAVVSDIEGRLPGSETRGADLIVLEIRKPLWPAGAMDVQRPFLRLVQGSSGEWQPVALRGFALRNAETSQVHDVLERVARSVGLQLDFRVTGATVVRRAADALEDAPVFGGLSWRQESVVLEGQGPVRRHRVSYQTRNGVSVGEDGLQIVDWLSARGREPLLLWGSEALIRAEMPEEAEVPSPRRAEGAESRDARDKADDGGGEGGHAEAEQAPGVSAPLMAAEPKDVL